MKCPTCGGPIRYDLDSFGGCIGHFGPDDYCYCDSPDFRMVAWCVKPTRKCRGPILVPGLTDKYSIERWIAQRLEKEEQL